MKQSPGSQEGRIFLPEENAVIVNEEALKELQLKENRPFEKNEGDAGFKFEKMARDLLKRYPEAFEAVFLSSEPDDENGSDIITFLKSEKKLKLAIQITATDNPLGMKKKLDGIIRNPVIKEITDEKGQPIIKGVIPTAIAPLNKKVWGEALNKSINDKAKDASIALPEKEIEKFFKGIINSLEIGKKYDVIHKDIFEDIINLLNEKIIKLLEKRRIVH